MKCPQCGGRTKVTNSRYVPETRKTHGGFTELSTQLNFDEFIGRHRCCEGCGHTLKTVELLEDDLLDLIRRPRKADIDKAKQRLRHRINAALRDYEADVRDI